jgi:hypothetical protein
MQISLKSPNYLWFTPGSEIHLTEENPGPVDINFDNLSKDIQKLIVIGVQTGKLNCSESSDILLNKYSSENKLNITVGTLNVDEESGYSPSQDFIKKLALARLSEKLNDIENFLKTSNDVRLVKFMLELEKENKDRNKVIQILTSKLDDLTSKIQISITNERSILQTNVKDPLADQFEIIDSEIEQVEVEVER